MLHTEKFKNQQLYMVHDAKNGQNDCQNFAALKIIEFLPCQKDKAKIYVGLRKFVQIFNFNGNPIWTLVNLIKINIYLHPKIYHFDPIVSAFLHIKGI